MNASSKDLTFVPETVHKRDVFSETISGHLAENPDKKVVLRKLDAVPWWARPIAWFLARREIRGLRAVAGIVGVPELLRVDREGLLRDWTHGTPLQLRKPDGSAGVIDFQLASVHRRRGSIFRVMAREDLRHLLKQKRNFAPHLLTPTERRMLARKSLPTRIWMATGKRLYNFVTRKLMNWSDGEGTEDRIARDGPAVIAALQDHDAVNDVALFTYALSAKGVGLYAFVETQLTQAELRKLVPETKAELLQPISTLPRKPGGTVRDDALQLIATNRLDELELLMDHDSALKEVLSPIIATRLNLTDRILRA